MRQLERKCEELREAKAAAVAECAALRQHASGAVEQLSSKEQELADRIEKLQARFAVNQLLDCHHP